MLKNLNIIQSLGGQFIVKAKNWKGKGPKLSCETCLPILGGQFVGVRLCLQGSAPPHGDCV